MEESVYEVLNLTKKIEGKSVLKEVSFKIRNNASTAIIGQNGSGKSITLKILAGIYKPTRGKIIKHTRKIGYVPEHFPENLRFTLEEYLKIAAVINGFSRGVTSQKIRDYVNLFQIESLLETPLVQCSKGTRQKVGLIQALLKNPDILLLDEPLTGLDTESQLRLINLLNNIKSRVAVIFTTHNKEMVKGLADDVLNIEKGKISAHKFEIKPLKKIIKIKFQNIDALKKFNLNDIDYLNNIAFLRVDSTISDKVLINLLNENCSILEVRETR